MEHLMTAISAGIQAQIAESLGALKAASVAQGEAPISREEA